MRRWLRHYGDVRGRISCESDNWSQLTAGWTAARMERQRGRGGGGEGEGGR